ncbi:MAG: HAMP domain-containing histidine kinase, partial [Clostridia bacterium]|nr:HAMP domain-containing histidine kinase [Clostridia bacterium]
TVFYDGENYTCDLSRIAAIDENEAVAMAKSVLSGGSDRGYKGEVYRYLKTEIEGKQAVVFVDCFRQMQTARQFLLYSVVISLVGIAGVFALIFFLSGKALKPVIESYEKQKRFITDAGHELKTPLTVISANNEIIEIEHGEDECTRAISAQVNKMNALVKNLTALARMEEGGGIKGEEFSLSDALNEAAENFRSVFDRSDKKFTVETEENLYKGDESLIRRLFYLILDNCAKYSVTFANVKEVKEGGKIKIYFKNDAENLTGGDMPEVFERFYRSAESRATKEGSGIGLSVAKEIVLMHGGKISARAEGGIFCIEVIL